MSISCEVELKGHTVGHPKSGIEVDVSVYKGVGSRVVRSSYDDRRGYRYSLISNSIDGLW